MKISSQQRGSGRLGNTVYAQMGGVCVTREYRETIANPNTEGQQTQRSKFKLMSQLGAAMSPYIAIRKEGLKSARNLFTQINIPNATMSDGTAVINLNRIQLTKSGLAMPDFTADRSAGNKIAVALAESVASGLDGVVYSAFTKEVDGSLIPFASVVVNAAGTPAQFAGELPFTAKSVVIYAYGYRLNTAAARAMYGNMQAPSAEEVAKLFTSSSEAASGTTLMKTKGLTMNVGENTGSSDSVEHFMVSVSASGNGHVSGGGSYVAGQTATLTATPDAEASFVAWHRGSKTGPVLSTNANYSFEVTEAITIVGVFEGGPVPSYSINATVNPATSGSVAGTGTKQEGSTCTLVATPAEGKVFLNWTENGQTVSTSATYSFTVERARNLVANFVDEPSDKFSNVAIDGTPWNANVTTDRASKTITGVCNQAGATKIGLWQSSDKPSIGTNIVSLKGVADMTPGQAFEVTSGQFAQGTTYWLTACHLDGNFDDYVCDAVYDYNVRYPM